MTTPSNYFLKHSAIADTLITVENLHVQTRDLFNDIQELASELNSPEYHPKQMVAGLVELIRCAESYLNMAGNRLEQVNAQIQQKLDDSVESESSTDTDEL